MVDLIRGQQAGKALNTLQSTNKRIAPTVEKVLRSAIANADNLSDGKEVDVDRRQAVRQAGVRQRRAAHEAHAAGADGPGLPVSAPHRAHRIVLAETNAEWRFDGNGGRRQNAGPKKAAAAPHSSKGQEERAGKKEAAARSAPRRSARKQANGTESTSVRIPAGLQQAVAVALVRQADYAKLLLEDLELKAALTEQLKSAGVSSIEVDRPGNKLRVTIRTSRPGIIIGRKGAEIEKLKAEVQKEDQARSLHRHSGSAQAGARCAAGVGIDRAAAGKARGIPARDAQGGGSALRFGCKGIKVRVAGRLNGAEIARREWYLQGRLPLHTLRADIDYGFTEAHTTYGVIGVKCWVYKGEILPAKKREATPARETTGAF